MKIGDTMRGARDTYKIAGLFEDTPNGMVWRVRSQQEPVSDLLVAAPASGSGGDGLVRYQANLDALKRLAESAQIAWLVDWNAGPDPFLVVGPPTGAPISELAVQSGPLSEAEALLFLHQLAGLLQALHTEANAALAPSTFEQTHWDGAGQRIWLPLWHALALAPDFERQAMDLTQAGVLAHLALLGRPPTTLWGEPVVLDELPTGSGTLSRGAWRLLRRLLHPDPDSRLASAAELVRVLDSLLNAWQDEPDQVSGAAQDLFDQAQAGAAEKAWQADSIVDILERRGLEMPITFDWLKEDVESFVQRRQAMENALHLARAGSNAAATEQLRSAPTSAGEDLPLLRWRALLVDLDAHWFDANSALDQPLQSVVNALEMGDLETAGVALGALTEPPASLTQELAARTAWRAAVGQVSNAGAAVNALDAALTALGQITDPDLRTALDRSLGGLTRWRRRATRAEATVEQAARVGETRERLQSARQQGQWTEAMAELHAGLALYPRHPVLLTEGMALGIGCLTAHQPSKALEVFALIAGQTSDQPLARLGWRVARAEIAVSVDPFADASLVQVRLATDLCLQLAAPGSDSQAIIISLQGELAAAAALAERMNHLDSGAALRSEIRRVASMASRTGGQPGALLALEAAIQRALAEDEAAAIDTLTRYSPATSQPARPNTTGQSPALRAEPAIDRVEPAAEKSTGLVGRLFKSSTKATTAAPESIQPKATDSKPSPLAEHLLRQLISVDFDQMAAALDDLGRHALSEAETARLALWTEQANNALTDHQRSMERVLQLATAGAVVQAQQELRKATRADKSRTCWDPKTSTWVPISHWQMRLSPPSMEQIAADISSLEPERWARALRLPIGLLERWSADLKRAAQQRQQDLDHHQSELDFVLADAASDPVAALQAFEAWQSHRSSLMLCWDARHSRWAAPGEILADLRMAVAHTAQRSPATRQESATTPNETILEALNSNDPQRWEQVVNMPQAQRSGWTTQVIALANQRNKDLLIHRREMELVLQGFATDPLPVKERMMKWRSTNHLATNWDSRNQRWTSPDVLWLEIDRAVHTVQASKWLDMARQRMLHPKLGYVKDAIIRGLAFTNADPTVLKELKALLDQTQSGRRTDPVGISTAPPTGSLQLPQATPPSHPPGSLGALLEIPLRESKTLTQLQIGVSTLAAAKPEVQRSINKLALDLHVWVEEERWLGDAEEQKRNGRLAQTSISHARTAIQNLDRLLRTDAWRPYVTAETPAFANVRRRLQAIAGTNAALNQPKAPSGSVPTKPASPRPTHKSVASSDTQQTPGSRKLPEGKTPPAQAKPAKTPTQSVSAPEAGSPASSSANGVNDVANEQFQEQLRKHLRNTNSLTIVQARLESMAVVYKEQGPELNRLVDEIVALRAAESELDEILKLAGRPPDADSARRAAEVQTRIAALSLPIRPKAIKDLEKKAQTVQHLAKP